MRIHFAVLLSAAALLPLIAQTPKSNTAADWPMYNRDLSRHTLLSPDPDQHGECGEREACMVLQIE